MNGHRTKHLILVLVFLLTACAKKVQTIPPAQTNALPTVTVALPTETSTAAPSEIPAPTNTPAPTADPAVFGSIGQNEIQAFALESVATAIFNKTFDSLVADGRIQEYQVTHVTVFPGSGGLLSEIIFNVRTSDTTWLEDGGTPAADNWINDKCYRFDFFTTETEFQLKNRRACS
jgi:hypothetical protein